MQSLALDAIFASHCLAVRDFADSVLDEIEATHATADDLFCKDSGSKGDDDRPRIKRPRPTMTTAPASLPRASPEGPRRRRLRASRPE
eukprot:3722132-Pyramimonas_sp.AAC.1